MSDFEVGVDWTTPQHGNSAHADLKATITEQAAEIERLKEQATELESLRVSMKGVADRAFDTLNGPQSVYYEGLKNIMAIAIAAAPKQEK